MRRRIGRDILGSDADENVLVAKAEPQAKPHARSGYRQHGLHQVSNMRKKYGKFYADWRDQHGHRRMKAFPTKPAALKHQDKQRRAIARKKARASAPSQTSARRGSKANQQKPMTAHRLAS